MQSAKYETDRHYKLWVRKDGAMSVTRFSGPEQEVVKFMRHLIKEGATIHGCMYVVEEDRFDLVPAIGDQASVKRRMIGDLVDFDF